MLEHGQRRKWPIKAWDGTVGHGGKHKHLSTPVTWTRIVKESTAFVTVTGLMSSREFRELLILLYGDNIVSDRVFTAVRYLPNKKSRISSWKLRAIRSGFYELHRMQSRVSCREARPPSPCCSTQMWTEKYLWRHGRPMYAFKRVAYPCRLSNMITPSSFWSKSDHSDSLEIYMDQPVSSFVIWSYSF